MSDKQQIYEEAIARLDVIISNIERGTLPLDQLTAQISEAQTLIAFCKKQLQATEQAVNSLLNDGKE